MMGSNKRAEMSEAIASAVKSAGGLVGVAFVVACTALIVGGIALLVVTMNRPRQVT